MQKGISKFFIVVQEFLMQLYPWPKSGEFRTFAEPYQLNVVPDLMVKPVVKEGRSDS